tara:strand:- start:135 stop:311 length:177 start_codon:yes stop_codon:yes gene_type:complete
MIEIGTLVRYKNYEEMAIVIDHWIDDTDGKYHCVVKWLNGNIVGQRSAEYNEDLEVIA